MSYSQVILVDENDHEIGVMEKLQAHREGKLHRAFSVLVFNSKGEILLQKRADKKYHSPGLWTNACCSHPQPLEETAKSASRRLQEEIGIIAETEFLFSFIYKTEFKNGMIENEYDHVFTARSNQLPKLNPEEASDWRYISLEDLDKDLEAHPDHYTFWFKVIMEMYRPAIVQNG